MSQHQSHESDRFAAFRGLVLGAIVLGILLVTIVRLTNAHYATAAGSKTATSSPVANSVAIDT
ncbi:MAG TPA: hypothetical protein VF368_08530 [Gemmatimonadaceae bacterium]